MAEEINKMLDEVVGDLKQALDILLEIVAEDISEEATGYPRFPHTEKVRKFNIALGIYNKHFVCWAEIC